MKRFLALLAVVAAAAAALAVPSGAVDTQGPACADIASGTGGYTLDPPELLFFVNLAAPSCGGAPVTYTFEIYASDETTLLARQTLSGDGDSTTLTFLETFEVVPDPVGLCVVGITSIGRHVVDRAPDSGCSPIDPESGGGVGFQ